MEKVIEINNLSKSYKDLKAVNNLSFYVKESSLFAFLGENGAGKSTTISIICGLLNKDAGTVIVNGHDIDKEMNLIKNDLGVVFQNSVLDKQLSVRDNLKHRASLYGIIGNKFEERLLELANLFDFTDFIDRPIMKLSGGQKRKIDIARALIHKPKILILDEPTTGLDPQTRKNVWDVLTRLRQEEKMTILLTTHYMEEASEANHILIIDKGEMIAEGTPIELKDKYANDNIFIYDVTEDEIKKLNVPYVKIPSGYKIEVESTKDATKLISTHPELFKNFEVIKGKMDDVFLNVTGKTLEEVE